MTSGIDWQAIIIATIATIGSGGIIVAYMRRAVTAAEAAKVKADADLTQGEGWQALLKAQQSQLDRLQAEVETLRMAKLACEAELGELRRRLAALERAAAPAKSLPEPKPVRAIRGRKPANGAA